MLLLIAVQDIIAILGMDELSEEDKLTVSRHCPAPTLQKADAKCVLGRACP